MESDPYFPKLIMANAGNLGDQTIKSNQKVKSGFKTAYISGKT